MRHLAAMAMLAVAASAAVADEVVLRNGARFEGQVKESGDTVTVVMDFGSITFKKMDVARIERGASALSEFDAKVTELKSDDLEGRYKLGLWAKQKGLDQRAQRLFEEILVRNPDHAGARESLGYRRHGNRWLTEDEVRIEKGLTLFRGEWIRREVADDIRRIESERAAESSRYAELETLRIRAAEAEAAVYRAREEASQARAQADYDSWYRQPLVVFRYIPFRRPCPPAPCGPPVKPAPCVVKKVN